MTPEHQQAEREALKPCPFCGSDDLKHSNNKDGFWHHWVQCNACEGAMDTNGSTAKAIAKWNRRAGERADVVPPGMVLVPVEPTNAMWDAAVAEQNRIEALALGQHPSCFQIYKAMVAAAPASSDVVPLSEEHIEQGWLSEDVAPTDAPESLFEAGARFAEKRHGIAASQESGKGGM